MTEFFPGTEDELLMRIQEDTLDDLRAQKMIEAHSSGESDEVSFEGYQVILDEEFSADSPTLD